MQLQCPLKAGRVCTLSGVWGACIITVCTPVRGPPKSRPEEPGLYFPPKDCPSTDPHYCKEEAADSLSQDVSLSRGGLVNKKGVRESPR